MKLIYDFIKLASPLFHIKNQQGKNSLDLINERWVIRKNNNVVANYDDIKKLINLIKSKLSINKNNINAHSLNNNSNKINENIINNIKFKKVIAMISILNFLAYLLLLIPILMIMIRRYRLKKKLII